MKKKPFVDSTLSVYDEVMTVLRKHEPKVAFAAVLAILDVVIMETVVDKRETCLRISRHFLEKSKVLKQQLEEVIPEPKPKKLNKKDAK